MLISRFHSSTTVVVVAVVVVVVAVVAVVAVVVVVVVVVVVAPPKIGSMAGSHQRSTSSADSIMAAYLVAVGVPVVPAPVDDAAASIGSGCWVLLACQ